LRTSNQMVHTLHQHRCECLKSDGAYSSVANRFKASCGSWEQNLQTKPYKTRITNTTVTLGIW
jgi:hypothetical protein